MLQAKFLRVGKGKFAIYEVRGTSAELKSYTDSIEAKGLTTVRYKTDGVDGPVIKDDNGNSVPLFFTAFPMPDKEKWYNLVLIESGKNKGNYTLDTLDLSFDKLLSNSMGQDLGEHITAQLASKHTGVSLQSKAPKASASSVILTDDDEDLTEDASASADMDAIPAEKQPEAKASGKGNK